MSSRPGAIIGAVVAGCALWAPHLSAQPSVELAQLERDVEVAEGELTRIEGANARVPDLFSVKDRGDRAMWGAIYHDQREYARASMVLYGAVEAGNPTDQAALEATPEYAESLYFLANSLYEVGNIGAARVYFEKLLRLRQHSYHDDAIIRLMAIASDAGRYDDVDRYYADYLAVAGTGVSSEVRYLRGKSLFRSRRDDAAVKELQQIANGNEFDLRARYLQGAILVRSQKLDDALRVFDDLLKQKPVVAKDAAVLELAHMARGRIFYEQDRLEDSINAYQAIEFDSKYLTDMLYEVTLTYVRRGQIAQRLQENDKRTALQRHDEAKVEYKKALRQLDDLRALDPEGVRASDIDLLAANLTLQLQDFDEADAYFGDVLTRYRSADAELQQLAEDASVRGRILQDILALENNPRAVLQSPLPPIAARRAARNRDVARSVVVFKDLQRSLIEVEETERLLAQLEEKLSPDNPSRAELFGALQSAMERSNSLSNTLTRLRVRAVNTERGLARPSPATKEALAALAAERKELQAKIQTLPSTPEAMAARSDRFKEQADAVDRTIHELELVNDHLRAGLVSSQWLAERELVGEPAKQELAKTRIRELGADVTRNDDTIKRLKRELTATREKIRTVSGRGSAEEQLRRLVASKIDEERRLLVDARDPSQAPLLARLDSAVRKIDAVAAANVGFRDRIDVVVEERLRGAMVMIQTEKAAITAYRESLQSVDQQAAGLRDEATRVALDRVRRDIAGIVLSADVGIIDTAFARKQVETEHIGRLQRARGAELTDLTQAYADLTRDELP